MKKNIKMHKGMFQNGHTLTVGEKNPMFGKKRPAYIGEAVAKANKRRIWTTEMRQKHSVVLSGRKQDADWIEKRIVNIKGNKHYAWQGGKTPINEKIRHSLKYRNWRKAVFERDNYTCQICATRNHKGLGRTVRLEADHIKPFALFPELRFDLNNGRTVCARCHERPGRYPGTHNSLKVAEDVGVL